MQRRRKQGNIVIGLGDNKNYCQLFYIIYTEEIYTGLCPMCLTSSYINELRK